jgi:hypothetical protein
MGLDWCLKDKIVNNRESEYHSALEQVKRSNQKEADLYQSWLSRNGHEAPAFFPNPITDAYHASEEYKAHAEAAKKHKEELGKYCISPMETIGAPQVGKCEEATALARKQYKESYEDKSPYGERFRARFPTEEEYLKDCDGSYVPELAKDQRGLASVSGMFVGAESFRGKIVGMVEWLPEELRDTAYNELSAEELVTYGKALLEEAAEYKSLNDEEGLTPQEASQVSDIEAAGGWCVYWGSAGHAMSPWY